MTGSYMNFSYVDGLHCDYLVCLQLQVHVGILLWDAGLQWQATVASYYRRRARFHKARRGISEVKPF